MKYPHSIPLWRRNGGALAWQRPLSGRSLARWHELERCPGGTALDPVFVSRIAEGLELNSDRIELIEQRRSTDPTLQHIAVALRVAVQTGDALDHMYGEGLSTALAAHLLREYGVAVLRPKRQYGRLPRKKLARAVEYIQDQLDADLTVSGIAQAVGMSPESLH